MGKNDAEKLLPLTKICSVIIRLPSHELVLLEIPAEGVCGVRRNQGQLHALIQAKYE